MLVAFQIVFPLMSTLGADSSSGPAITRTRILATELLAKLFLRYLIPHDAHAQTLYRGFHLLFLSTLTTMERYVHLGQNSMLVCVLDQYCLTFNPIV